MKSIFLFVVGFIILFSCSLPSKIIKYPERKNEFYTITNLHNFLKANDSLRIVLRIDESAIRAGATDSNKSFSNLFYLMENELIKLGFSVKDRTIFNNLISKTASPDILKKELYDTDLILEVVSIDDKVIYSTNIITSINKKSSEEQQSLQYKSLGAYVEYRVILVKNNEIGGAYKFFYQPCAHGCPLNDFKFSGKGNHRQTQLPKELPHDIIQQFISTSIQELVNSFKEK